MAGEIELKGMTNQYIVGRIPSWIARWGNFLIMIIIAILLFLSFMLKYPVVLQGNVEIDEHRVYIAIPNIKFKYISEFQIVGLKMDNYPFIDYGFILGEVGSLKQVINKDNKKLVPIEILDKRILTKELDLTMGMQGSGEITVENRPIIYRVFKIK